MICDLPALLHDLLNVAQAPRVLPPRCPRRLLEAVDTASRSTSACQAKVYVSKLESRICRLISPHRRQLRRRSDYGTLGATLQSPQFDLPEMTTLNAISKLHVQTLQIRTPLRGAP